MSAEVQARLDLALAAAREAGRLTLRYFRTADLAVERKRDQSPVTIADRQSEQLLRERIASAFPSDGILGEELGEQPGTSGFRWILDPIDGTQSFIHGVPLYGTLVGIEQLGRPVAGVIEMPALSERAFAAAGGGAWYEGPSGPRQRAHVSACTSLATALVCTSGTRIPTSARFEALVRLQQAAQLNRTWGDCYGYLMVAVGRAEVMVDPIMNVWDAAAVQPIVVEAGGTFTDWQGNPTIYNGDSIATNGRVLEEVLALTRGA